MRVLVGGYSLVLCFHGGVGPGADIVQGGRDVIAEVELMGTRDGVTQLQRRWRPDSQT